MPDLVDNRRIPDRLSKEVKQKYRVDRDKKYFATTPRENIRDLIEVELGDSKTPDSFLPQVKIMRWGNEANCSFRLKHFDEFEVVTDKEKIKLSKPDTEVHFYELPDGYEFEVVWLEKPTVNYVEFSINDKDVEYYYQPPLTPEEVAEGVVRPENVVGSYAVYARSEKRNIDGGTIYQSGKIGHIYRPKVKDANGAEVWGELYIFAGVLTVTVPQEFLDNAIYPVYVDPTFGYTSAGATSGSSANMIGSSFTITENGDVTSITQYALQDGSNSVAAGIYSDTGSDMPNTLLAEDSGNTIGTGSATWLTNNISVFLSANTKYWLVGWASDSRTVYWDTGATNQYISDGGTWETWKTSWGGTGTRFARKLSIYATYTTGGTDCRFLQSANSTTDASSYTFSSQNLGQPASDRYIVVTILSRKSGGTTTITGVTVGGVNATIVRQVSNNVTNTNVAGIAIAAVPTGTTGDIVVTFGATMTRCLIGVYRALAISPTETDGQTSTAADPTANLNIPANGFAIAAATSAASTSASWTGLSENFDTVVESFQTMTGAMSEFVAAQTALAITADFTSSTECAGVFASWGPPIPVNPYTMNNYQFIRASGAEVKLPDPIL